MKLRIVTPYGPGAASSRARVFEWLARAELRAEILEYVGAESSSAAILLRSPLALVRAELAIRRPAGQRADVVLMHRYASPFSRGEVEERLLRSGDRSVVDFDDALQWDWRSGMTGLVKRPSSFLRAARAADVIIAGNASLANWASEWCKQVVLIPTCVEPEAYEVKSNFDVAQRPRLGWIGSPSTEGYLRLIEAPLLELHRRTGAVLVVISAGERSLGPLDEMVKRVQWSLQAQAQLGSLMDVGLMPLDDSLWTRSKCGYKLLQYAAAAVPAVSSPVGVNAEIAASLGYRIAQSDAEWVDALVAVLLSTASDRAREGLLARSGVAGRYSYETWMPTWSSAVFGEPVRQGNPTTRIRVDPDEELQSSEVGWR